MLSVPNVGAIGFVAPTVGKFKLKIVAKAIMDKAFLIFIFILPILLNKFIIYNYIKKIKNVKEKRLFLTPLKSAVERDFTFFFSVYFYAESENVFYRILFF